MSDSTSGYVGGPGRLWTFSDLNVEMNGLSQLFSHPSQEVVKPFFFLCTGGKGIRKQETTGENHQQIVLILTKNALNICTVRVIRDMDGVFQRKMEMEDRKIILPSQ